MFRVIDELYSNYGESEATHIPNCGTCHVCKEPCGTDADDVAEPVRVEEAYEPRVGDRVSLEGEVVEIEEGGRLNVKLQPSAGEIYLYPIDVANGVLKLLSRKTRKLTKEEAQEILTKHLNENIVIE